MKASLLVGIISIGLMLSSCSWGGMSPDTPESNSGTNMVTDTYTETLKTTSDKIKESPEFTECMNMNVNMCVNRAATQIAQNTQSLEFCDELGSEDQIQSCKFGITLNLSRSKKDINICNEVNGEYKTRCIMEFHKASAIDARDTKLCGKLLTVSGEGIDMERVNRDVDQCMTSIIMTDSKKGVEACEDISDISMKEMCKSMKNTTN